MSNFRKSKLSFSLNSRGFVSITITMVIMFVLIIIVMSFARIIRREQRQALDRQLNTQAFYAAESSVNAVGAYLVANPTFNTPKTDCTTPSGVPAIDNTTVLDSSSGVEVTCLLFDPAPETLEYSNVSSESKVVPIRSAEDPVLPLNSISLSWRDKANRPDNLPNCVGTQSFPTNANWNRNTGIIRVDLVSVNGSLTRNTLLQNTFTAFLFPCNNAVGGSTTFASAGTPTTQGRIVNTYCPDIIADPNDPAVCTMTITLPGTSSRYYMRIRTIYGSSALSIEATDSGGRVELKEAQAVIDVTAKANDVLRRIQVRKPIGLLTTQNLPDYVLNSTEDLCKRFSVVPTAGSSLLDTGGCPTN